MFEETNHEVLDHKIRSITWSQRIVNSLFSYTYQNDFYKKLRWNIESSGLVSKIYKTFSRNQLLFHSVENYVAKNQEYTDLLQEYFVPLHKFPEFVDFLQSMKLQIGDSLMNITIRHVLEDRESLLNYAHHEMICFVMFFRGPKSIRFDNDLKQSAQKITNKVLELDGSYYLPYRPYQTSDQFERAYTKFKEFKKIKSKYDPGDLFINQFYKNYLYEAM
ncbi:MAG: hypothetical protein HKM07_06760 [Chlamydiae bacterium]|nr:hypothetical protein [Chlamydiota bacterium]